MPAPEQGTWGRWPLPPQRRFPSKLTRGQREDIIRRSGEGETPMALAAEYGVSASRIRQLRQYVRPS